MVVAGQRAGLSRRSTYSALTASCFLVLHAEGRAAAAGRDDVRVHDLEPGAGERVDVVDLRAVDVGEALRVDEQLEPVVLEDDVAVAALVERELVLEARAAAALDADPQAGDLDVGALRGEELAHLVRADLREGDAAWP